MWGAFCVYGAAFPGHCGDNIGPGLGVIESWVIDVPMGILLLLAGWLIRKGSPRLRTICIAISLVTLCLPLVATFFIRRWHCP
jgi:hypothetical protein